MIQIKQLNKVFRTSDVETQALNNVNLDIAKGDFVAIMGPSGCGKSTLLNIIGLLDNPTSGNYLLDGIEMGSLKESQRTSQRKGRIGFVFQSFNLIDELTVAENIELPLTYLGVPKKERRIKVDNLLQRLNLSHRSRHYPQQLSGGQQQRVAIARAIVGDPVILLADEPTGNLDSKMGAEVMDILHRLNKEDGRTIVMVTHNEDQARQTDRIVRFFDGHQI